MNESVRSRRAKMETGCRCGPGGLDWRRRRSGVVCALGGLLGLLVLRFEAVSDPILDGVVISDILTIVAVPSLAADVFGQGPARLRCSVDGAPR